MNLDKAAAFADVREKTNINRFQAVIQFLRKELGWQSGESLVRSLIYAFSIMDEELLLL